MLRAFKVRLYLNKSQEHTLNKLLGCYRFVYNQTLQHKKEFYELNKKGESRKDTQHWVQHILLKQYDFLKEFNTNILKAAQLPLEYSYKRFFKKVSAFPKFKSRRDKQSVKFYKGTCISISNLEDGLIHLTKNISDIKFRTSKRYRNHLIKCRECIKNITISKDKTNTFYASILVDTDANKGLTIIKKPTNDIVGIDLGIKSFAVFSTGNIVENLKFYRSNEKKLKFLQRDLSRKQKDSKNWEKAKLKLVKFYKYITNKKLDFLHKLTSRIINENQVIVLEDLNVKGMLQNNKLSKAIQELSLYEFYRQIEYKSKWNGRTLITTDRYYPSSKMCSCCGWVNKDLALKDRLFECLNCGIKLDRDFNASKNLEKYGLKILNGEGFPSMSVEILH